MITETAIHQFEAAKLGKAPFRCVGMCSIPSSSMAGTNPDAYNNALAALPRDIGVGSCAFCGMCLTHNFIIESADDRRFVVGCECVMRCGDGNLITVVKAERSKMAKEKRVARQNVKRADREAAYKAARDARAVDFVAIHAALIARAAPFIANNPFVKDVIEGGQSGRFISDKAIDAVTRVLADMERRAAQKINSRHVGTIGKRETFTVTVDRIASFDRPRFNAFGMETVWIITLRDDNGNAIVSKSASFYAERGESLKIKATVKDHSSYDGEQQTIVQRIKVQ